MTDLHPALLVATAFIAILAARPVVASEERSVTSRDVTGVVELFTSQGCSSCPTADKLLTRLSEDSRLVALAYHVDYWDYIGWQDTHGSRENTERQRAYAKALGKGGIYTPQMVVNGRRGAIGSREDDIRKALAETSLQPSPALLTLSVDGKRLRVGVENGSGGPGSTTVLMLVTFTETTETPVERGENKGLTLIDSHAVRDWRILGMGSDKPMETEIPLAALKPDPATKIGCAAILQSVTEGGQPGPILAAAAIEF
ncbi:MULTISPECIES: DUF1223 domain-containing protein [unclassified Aureimonas]|uniref:DUF1223 domain-containing protein n=1 Tax=unclassified Aureimonas TaxID=2615206 RepID=UPI0006F3B260|nr:MULTISPECIES: DUF1223 domain-containing protein [unclassified Aureimonas]KQT65910.1 hypothetical protein ASG62_20490 [Aureimonas sp. Leaf427]KQT73269.1 hypothetical protein ASG54_16970 [Aureimonas sp. Leaf460]